MTQEGVKELEGKLLPKMDILSKIDQQTVYFEGLTTIVERMKEIAKTNKIVIFIDDLDRCNSNKALEVFESTKVFLDIEGFVFVFCEPCLQRNHHTTLFCILLEKTLL